jgi:hypothetical protein
MTEILIRRRTDAGYRDERGILTVGFYEIEKPYVDGVSLTTVEASYLGQALTEMSQNVHFALATVTGKGVRYS